MADESFAAEDTIFAQFEYGRLKACLENCAAALGKKIVWGSSDRPDLLATPAFVAVIDRRVVDSETYDHYPRLEQWIQEALAVSATAYKLGRELMNESLP